MKKHSWWFLLNSTVYQQDVIYYVYNQTQRTIEQSVHQSCTCGIIETCFLYFTVNADCTVTEPSVRTLETSPPGSDLFKCYGVHLLLLVCI